MRVALVTDGITPYVIGGMQKHSFYLARCFARNKIYVDLVHMNQSELDISKLECFSEEEKPYIRSIVLEFPVNPKFPGHYLLSSWQYSKLAYEALLPTLNSYDFIYTKGFTGWKLINEKYKGRIRCAPIGVKFHGYEMFQVPPDIKTKLQHRLMRPFVKKISRRADNVFSYGGKITGIIESLGVTKTNIIELPSGVEKNMIAKSVAHHNGDRIRFVFMGRSERRKGVPELNTVLKKLIADEAIFKFDFIGPIPAEDRILHKAISYHGEIRDFSQIRSILQTSDVLVCPSWSEGFPNVILEAMANGLAIIATDVGAVSAMVSAQNGWLIEAGDIGQLENAMKEAIASFKTLDSKKEHSLKLVNTVVNWDAIFGKLLHSISQSS